MAQPYYLVVAYDGTAYYGWQEQKHETTVAGTLQATFYRIFRESIKVVGASRTDTGVHALNQVCRFFTDMTIDPEHMRRVWNASLPPDIHIRELGQAEQGFHPQHNIVHKTYYYHMFPERPLPFIARYGWWPRYIYDVSRLEDALQAYVGTHDFRSFCSGDYTGDRTVCSIYAITVRTYRRYGVYQIQVRGNRFLQHMVRRMVGAAFDVAIQRAQRSDIVRALAERNPQQHFTTAPGNGLLLRNIMYKEHRA